MPASENPITVSLIVAVAKNGVIGRDNKLPWYLPEDLKYFKRITMGRPIIMGRRTFESIGKPLPGRTNIVVTRNPDYQAEGIRVVHTFDDAIRLAEGVGIVDGSEEVFVIGGAELFRQALNRAGRLYLTEVHADVHGDVLFPDYEHSDWLELGRENFSAEGSNPYDYSFVVLEKKGGS